MQDAKQLVVCGMMNVDGKTVIKQTEPCTFDEARVIIGQMVNGLFDLRDIVVLENQDLKDLRRGLYDADDVVTREIWLVETREHRPGGWHRNWWAPRRSGYTFDIEQAGHYGKKEAHDLEVLRSRMADGNSAEKAWRMAEVMVWPLQTCALID